MLNNKRFTFGFLALLLLMLGGCATQTAGPRGPVYTPQPKPMPPQEPLVRATPLEMGQPVTVRPLPQDMVEQPPRTQAPLQQESPVVIALLQDVDRLEGSGDFEQAAARVERGLRISPKDARLWQRLATIRMQQQRPEQAEMLAKKSSSLARGDFAMQAANWRIIAQSRQMRGDASGAQQARQRAEQLR